MAKHHKVKLSYVMRAKLRGALLKGRRETIYKMLLKRHCGKVPCFVCGKHVELKDATLEHILERRNGGTDAMFNLSISHFLCNQNRDKHDKAQD